MRLNSVSYAFKQRYFVVSKNNYHSNDNMIENYTFLFWVLHLFQDHHNWVGIERWKHQRKWWWKQFFAVDPAVWIYTFPDL